jgi:starch phosphorylase
MEIGLEPPVPTYSGGLGILAGDTIRSAADLQIPMVAVTLLHRAGHFYQRLDSHGNQQEEPVSWPIDDFLEPVDASVDVEVEGRTVELRAWRYRVRGVTGFEVPVYLLDADLPANAPEHRQLTGQLYGGDVRYRLCQEALLGLGGLRLLRALGDLNIVRLHLNEGHAALAILALLEEAVGSPNAEDSALTDALENSREQCVFTTHTPVPAGHDQFSGDLVRAVLGERRAAWLGVCTQEENLNMTELALRGSRYVNGVAMSHWEIARDMFPGYPVQSITNGVHAGTWAAAPFAALYDHYVPNWRRDALSLRYAIRIPLQEIQAAHVEAKRALIDHVNEETNAGFDRDVLTIGFARRATAYKRATLVFQDLERLGEIAEGSGPLQLVFAGKAHPKDGVGKEIIRKIHEARNALKGRIPIAYLANYGMTQAKLLCSGCDVWLNTPLPPLEASGTSGMKAALNGVPSLSILDGWWVEGHAEGVTGWAIGRRRTNREPRSATEDREEADALYEQLANSVIPCFYATPERFAEMRRYAISINAAFFNTDRMMWQYLHCAYRIQRAAELPSG